MPRMKKTIDAESNHSESFQMPASGALPERDHVIERQTDLSRFADKAELLSFMEEPVGVMIHESTDPNGEPFVYCAVNGVGAMPKNNPWIPRGKPVTIKRKHVERLARAKRVGVRTDEVMDAHGARTTAVRKTSGLAYPFSITHDPNPRGPAWLSRVLAEA